MKKNNLIRAGHLRQIFPSNEYLQAGAVLVLLLNVFFFPVIWGNKTLMNSVRDVQSIMPYGAYGEVNGYVKNDRTPDAGASGWVAEPYFKLKQQQYFKEHCFPLWNPYNAYGVPFSAQMDSETYYPLSILASISPSIRSYDLYLICRLFIAGIFTYMFLRFFIEKLPALFGAISFMFTGYFIIYINLPHLSVDVFLPGIFFFFELLLRKRDARGVISAAVAISLSLIGGMPESAFLGLTSGYLYFSFRVFTNSDFKKSKKHHFRNFILMNILGFLLSAFLLLPFFELVKNSFTIHTSQYFPKPPGAFYINFTLYSLLSYFAPFVFAVSPVFDISSMSIFYDTTGYYGIIPFIFALLSLAYYFFFPRDSGDRDIRLVCGFFSVAALLLVMKRYGLAPIQWVGYLPILKMVFFFKYQEPLISFFLACLSGIGFSVLFTEKCKPKLINTVICVFALVFAGIAISAWSPGEKAGLTGQHSASFYSYCVLIILTLLTVSILSYRYLSSKKKYALYCFFILLVFELFFIFLYPFFYMKKGYLADKTADPYKGAPFIEFLKKENVDYSRVFGRDGVLYPNWASAFGLFDVRFLDAMLYDKYRNFVRYFFIDKYGDKEVPFTLELFDRFTGQDTVFEYDFRTYSEKRFLQLSSVKYLLTMKSLGKDVEDTAIGRMIYDDEIKIYETSDILPRASVFYGAKLSDNENQVLSILKNPGFDIRQEVMIYSKDLGNNERSRLETINSLPPRKSEPAKIVSYTSQSVSIEAELDRSGILMLNDSNYPGWKVSVDGQEEIMLNVNYLFRGVFLDKGKHIILFTYQPMSFYIGLCISVVTLMLMIAASFNISKSASRSNDIS